MPEREKSRSRMPDGSTGSTKQEVDFDADYTEQVLRVLEVLTLFTLNVFLANTGFRKGG
jgi:hypothetical protein